LAVVADENPCSEVCWWPVVASSRESSNSRVLVETIWIGGIDCFLSIARGHRRDNDYFFFTVLPMPCPEWGSGARRSRWRSAPRLPTMGPSPGRPESMPDSYVKRILNANIYDLVQETPLDFVPQMS